MGSSRMGSRRYVGKNIATNDSAKHVVRALHVLRSELDAVYVELNVMVS